MRVILGIACSLYVIAEWMESSTAVAHRLLTRLNLGLLLYFALLSFTDPLPLWPSLLGVATQLLYRTILISFPNIPALSFRSIAGALM